MSSPSKNDKDAAGGGAHIHYGIARTAGAVEEKGPAGHTVEVAVDEMASRREAFDQARAKITQDIHKRFTVQLPTQDGAVKLKLREYGVPITLFGEGPYERRERLRAIMTGDKRIETGKTRQQEEEDEQQEVFYHVGSDDLQACRMDIAKYSIPASVRRLQNERSERTLQPEQQDQEQEQHQQWVQNTMSTELSQVGDERPLTQGKFSPDGQVFATTGWTGLVKLWSVPDGKHLKTLKGPETRCHGLAFAPIDENAMSTDDYTIATAMANGKIQIWNTERPNEPAATFTGHEDRVNRVVWHPMGKFVASTSHDTTWRLWDVERETELLCQEGHSSGTYGISMHPDGSLICTTDLGGIVRIWDLRSGRTVLPLQGHHDQVLGCDFSKHGWLVGTASEDNTVRLWDIRKRKCETVIQAHNRAISDVQFSDDGRLLMSSSYDKTVKLWSVQNHHCVKVLVGHEARVMGASLCPTGGDTAARGVWVGSVAFDRTFKLWGTKGSPEDMSGII